MSEQAKLPEGTRFTARVCLTHGKVLHGADLCAEPFRDGAGNTRYCDTAVEVDLLTVEAAQRSLRKALAQRDEEWRSGLLGDEAVEAVAERQAHRWEDIPELVRPERRFRARGDLQAALDKAAPDGGGGE